MAAHWGYLASNGPSTWDRVAPAAKGLHQSPIKIEKSEYDESLAGKALVIKYNPSHSQKILNNGHSFQVIIDGADSKLHGGPFPHNYQVEQFHFHWGGISKQGAEHLIYHNNKQKEYAAELHIVHWNKDLYSSFAEAAKSASGLGVLGVFLQVGHEPNPALQKIVDLLPKITHAGDSHAIEGGFDPSSLLPADKSSYWTYTGSLTTPPCYESVRFLLFREPIGVSESQLREFRKLHSCKHGETAHGEDTSGGHIVDNFRPICPLNDRKVLRSFKSDN